MVVFSPAAPKTDNRWTRHLLGFSPEMRIRLLLYIAFYTVLANIPYWLAARTFGLLLPGYFCAELIVVGLCALYVPSFVTAILFLLVTAADLLNGVCSTFYLPPRVCLEDVFLIRTFSWHRVLAAAALTFIVLLFTAAAAVLSNSKNRPPQRRLCALCLVATLSVFAVFDATTSFLAGHGLPWPLTFATRTDGTRDGMWARMPLLARTPVHYLAEMAWLDLHAELKASAEEKSVHAVPSATAVALRMEGIGSPGTTGTLPNIVTVIVESWGVANDPRLREALVAPYSAPGIAQRYRIVQGVVPFYGSTIPGEARELCGNSFGFHLLNASPAELQGCLPDTLNSLGYHTLAVHGMSGNIFSRSIWYRRIGFDEIRFHRQFRSQGLPDCPGAFTGTCDAAIAAWIGRRLEATARTPQFVHWMTLNSHLPVPVPPQVRNPPPCTSANSLTPGTALCSWFQLVENVNASVSKVALMPLARPTIFVVVGDHAPPFGSSALRDQFSQTDVPWVALLPRSFTPLWNVHPAPKSLAAVRSAPSVRP